MSLRQALINVSEVCIMGLEYKPLDSVYIAAAGSTSVFVILKIVSLEPIGE